MIGHSLGTTACVNQALADKRVNGALILLDFHIIALSETFLLNKKINIPVLAITTEYFNESVK